MRCAILFPLIFGTIGLVIYSDDAFGQVGTFNARAATQMGGGSSSTQKEQPAPTKDTLDKWLQEQISQLQTRLRAAKKGGVNSNARPSSVNWIERSKRYQFRTRVDRDREIQRLEMEINSPTLPALAPFSLKTGQIGSFPDHTKPVGLCAVGDGLVIPWDFKIMQILGEETAIILVGGQSSAARFFLISQMVKNFQEGQTHHSLPGAFFVDGNRKYKTAAGGVSTIPVLRSYDLSPHIAKLKK